MIMYVRVGGVAALHLYNFWLTYMSDSLDDFIHLNLNLISISNVNAKCKTACDPVWC